MELVTLVLYWADDYGRNSYHYPGMALVSSAGVGETLFKRGHYQPRSSLCLGHNQSVRLGEGVASLSELKISNLLMIPVRAIKEICTNHNILWKSMLTYTMVSTGLIQLRRNTGKLPFFETLLYPREMTSRHVLDPIQCICTSLQVMLSKLYRCHVNRLIKCWGRDILVECSRTDGHSVLYEAKVQKLFTHLGIFLVL